MHESAPTAHGSGRAGVIGLGAMGAPIARNLARHGRLAAVWNRTRAKAEAVAEQTGADLAADPADLAARCDVIVTSVADDAALCRVVDRLLPGLAPGKVVVDTSTVAIDTARRVAARIAAAGAGFLDAPVSGGVEGARRGALVMMVGGDPSHAALVRPVLECFTVRVAHLGDSGAGQATKAVNQVMAAGINQAVGEALALAQALELPLDQVIPLLSGGAAASWFLEHRGPSMTEGRYPPGFKVALHDKDLAICQAVAQDLGAKLPLVEMTRIHYRRLIDEGHGDEDISALHRIKRGLFST